MKAMEAVHAINRFGLGAKDQELKLIASDPRGWLLAQCKPTVNVSQIPIANEGMQIANSLLRKLRNGQEDDNLKKQAGESYIDFIGHRFSLQLKSEQPLLERLVLFWSNHFTVSTQKRLLTSTFGDYENRAIRPHVNGYFKDMLLAVTRHPTMLLYLDNAQSMGANSQAGKRRGKGINENLAREILELHTLGVNSGYGQQDVIALANMISGWSLESRDGDVLAYQFHIATHEPGEKVLLGKRFIESGEQEGIKALSMLATHPKTAEHIAFKLVRHFIADEPPADAVQVVAKSFIESEGHLPTVMQTLIAQKRAWQNPGNKLKTPYEFMLSALRLTGIEPNAQQVFSGLSALNFRPYSASSPAGFDDVTSAWSAPDAIMKRIEWSHKLAQRIPSTVNLWQLVQTGFGDTLSQSTQQQLQRAASATDAIALLLASPEFQRR